MGLCDGAFAQDLNSHFVSKPFLNPGPGATVQVQFLYRDPQNTSNQTNQLLGRARVLRRALKR